MGHLTAPTVLLCCATALPGCYAMSSGAGDDDDTSPAEEDASAGADADADTDTDADTDADTDSDADSDSELPAPSFWAVRAGGEIDDGAADVALLPDGSFHVVGTFGDDIFLSHYSARGEIVWTVTVGGPYIGSKLRVVAGTDGAATVVGSFQETLTAGEPPGATEFVSEGGNDLFLARYDSQGHLEWVLHECRSEFEASLGSIARGSSGEILVGGSFDGVGRFGRGKDAVEIGESFAEYRAFIARYQADGTLLLARLLNDVTASVLDMGLVSGGTLRVTGRYDAEHEDGEDESIPKMNTYNASYDSGGSEQWSWQDTGRYPKEVFNARVLEDGRTRVAGFYGESAGFTTGGSEITLKSDPVFNLFLSGYEGSGALAFAVHAAGTGGEDGQVIPYGIDVFHDGSTVMGGYYLGEASWGEAGDTRLERFHNLQGFFARYDASGGFQRVYPVVSPEESRASAVVALPDGSFIGVGYFVGQATFEHGGESITLESAGDPDVFIVKYPN